MTLKDLALTAIAVSGIVLLTQTIGVVRVTSTMARYDGNLEAAIKYEQRAHPPMSLPMQLLHDATFGIGERAAFKYYELVATKYYR
ncbi:hypothetical protein HYV82_02215 [Candidatus Woesearchaeota archaeon]|nr:hypothetical protein [Candidatus Woesearchaeota archaeon]